MGSPTRVHHLKTSGNSDDQTGTKVSEHSADWNLWAKEQSEGHQYRDIFCVRCGDTKQVPIYCKNRFCPVCSRGRRMKIQERLTWLLNHSKIDALHRLKLLTLTQPNSPELEGGVKRIVSAFKRLRQAPIWKQAFNSGSWVVEITGEPGRWHIHIHALLVGRYMQSDKLHAAWKALTGAEVLDIRVVSGTRAVQYITKYVAKGQFHPDYVLQVAHALRSVRLFNVFGQWHSMKAPKIKLVCECNRCHGTKWQAMFVLLPMTDSQLHAYLASLRDDWERKLHDEGRLL